MTRGLPGGYELDDDPGRVDLDVVFRYLSRESYWAEGRPRETVARLVREAARVVGVYHAGRQVGFARAVSDGVSFAYLADVFVLPDARGAGLGKELVATMIDRGPGAGFRWALHTDDAHGLYGKFGFAKPDHKYLERPRRAAGR